MITLRKMRCKTLNLAFLKSKCQFSVGKMLILTLNQQTKLSYCQLKKLQNTHRKINIDHGSFYRLYGNNSRLGIGGLAPFSGHFCPGMRDGLHQVYTICLRRTRNKLPNLCSKCSPQDKNFKNVIRRQNS